MLKNELIPVRDFFARSVADPAFIPVLLKGKEMSCSAHLEALSVKVRDAWTLAVFEDKNEKKLRRYFDYHLLEIIALFDKESEIESDLPYRLGVLIELTDHLLTYYNRFLDKKIALPVRYISWKLANLKPSADNISDLLITRSVDHRLANCLQTFLVQYFRAAHVPKITLGMLEYTSLVLQDLQETLEYSFQGDPTKLLVERLTALNFNQLLFFAYLKDEVRQHTEKFPPIEQHKLLQHKVAEVIKPKGVKGLYYDPNWPHISILLQSWLKEEVAILAEELSADMISLSLLKKIELNLSVPQLACFIWLFFEEKIDQLSNLTEIFDLTARYFSTKRQSAISAASLSNNYYGVNQATATNVKAMLLKMIGLLNKRYFPVMAVAGVLIGVC